MGRRKIEIKFLQDDRTRNVTFIKRKNGLFKKAQELSVLTGARVTLHVEDLRHRQFEFRSDRDVRMDSLYLNHSSSRAGHGAVSTAADGSDDDDDDEYNDDGDGHREGEGDESLSSTTTASASQIMLHPFAISPVNSALGSGHQQSSQVLYTSGMQESIGPGMQGLPWFPPDPGLGPGSGPSIAATWMSGLGSGLGSTRDRSPYVGGGRSFTSPPITSPVGVSRSSSPVSKMTSHAHQHLGLGINGDGGGSASLGGIGMGMSRPLDSGGTYQDQQQYLQQSQRYQCHSQYLEGISHSQHQHHHQQQQHSHQSRNVGSSPLVNQYQFASHLHPHDQEQQFQSHTEDNTFRPTHGHSSSTSSTDPRFNFPSRRSSQTQMMLHKRQSQPQLYPSIPLSQTQTQTQSTHAQTEPETRNQNQPQILSQNQQPHRNQSKNQSDMMQMQYLGHQDDGPSYILPESGDLSNTPTMSSRSGMEMPLNLGATPGSGSEFGSGLGVSIGMGVDMGMGLGMGIGGTLYNLGNPRNLSTPLLSSLYTQSQSATLSAPDLGMIHSGVPGIRTVPGTDRDYERSEDACVETADLRAGVVKSMEGWY